MNTRRVQRDIPRTPQSTNFSGGRGRVRILALGIRAFIDDLVSKDNYSTAAQNQGPSSVRIIPITPRREASVSMVERTIGAMTPSSVPADEDRASAVGLGEPEVVTILKEKRLQRSSGYIYIKIWKIIRSEDRRRKR